MTSDESGSCGTLAAEGSGRTEPADHGDAFFYSAEALDHMTVNHALKVYQHVCSARTRLAMQDNLNPHSQDFKAAMLSPMCQLATIRERRPDILTDRMQDEIDRRMAHWTPDFELMSEESRQLAMEDVYGGDWPRTLARCVLCNRALTNPQSIADGIGPECKTKGGA